MKLSSIYLALFISIFALISCDGDKQKVKEFSEKFADFVNKSELDSIRSVYPDADFESYSPLSTDSISVVETGKDSYRVNYSANKWIEVRVSLKGVMNVVDSKGVVVFPKDKYDIALKTGMLNDSTTDIKTHELLNEKSYFEWLNNKVSQSLKSDISLNYKKPNFHMTYYSEAITGTMVCTVTNNTNHFISGNDYSISYQIESENCTDGSIPNSFYKKSKKGVDLQPGASANITLNHINCVGFKKVTLEYDKKGDFKDYKPTGTEYQEYLKESKETDNPNYDWLSTREATSQDLENKSKEQLRIMRNWIYARHGYIFKSQDLTEYFSNFPWYEPTSRNVESQLNKTERDNISLIKSFE